MMVANPKVNQLVRAIEAVGDLKVGRLYHITEVRNSGDHVRVTDLSGVRPRNSAGLSSFSKNRFEAV